MRWSKLKSLVEERFTPCLSKRLSIHSAAYGDCSCGHCWITLDKIVIANFCTRAYYNRKLQGDSGTNSMYKKHLVLYGEISRQDAYRSMFDFIHSMSFDQALKSDDVLIQTLAVLDARLGKRRLKLLNVEDFHPLAGSLLNIRRNQQLISAGAS